MYRTFASLVTSGSTLGRNKFDLGMKMYNILPTFGQLEKNVIFLDHVCGFQDFVNFLSLAPTIEGDQKLKVHQFELEQTCDWYV